MVEVDHKWHLDRRVSVGHIVTTLVVVVSFVIWMLTLESRVSTNTLNIAYNKAAEEKHQMVEHVRLEVKLDSQTKRLEGRMEAQYNEIIRRLEILDQRMIDNNRADAKNHTQ